MAALLSACSDSGSTTTTPATTTDTSVGSSDGSVTGDGSSAAGSDATAGDTTAADTAKTDAKADTKDVPKAPEKCSYKDNMCLNSCAMAACEKEVTACQGDKACAAINGCLNKCDGVPLPADPTAPNCYKTCLDDAGDKAVEALVDQQSCVTGGCIGCDAGDQQCDSACASNLCFGELLDCLADNGCSGILDCFNTEKCTTAACQQACVGKFPDGQAALQAFGMCAQSSQGACAN
jgi:hypothetical protein